MKDLQFLRVVYLDGPNIWTYRPVIEAWVDIGDLEDSPSNTIPGFAQRLEAWLPSLVEHRCGVGERGGFLQRLREGTWPAHILEHVAIELQNLAGSQAGFGKARQTSVRGIYKLAFRSRNEQVGRACLEAARELVLAAGDEVLQAADEGRRRCVGPQLHDVGAAVRVLGFGVEDHGTSGWEVTASSLGARLRRVVSERSRFGRDGGPDARRQA